MRVKKNRVHTHLKKNSRRESQLFCDSIKHPFESRIRYQQSGLGRPIQALPNRKLLDTIPLSNLYS